MIVSVKTCLEEHLKQIDKIFFENSETKFGSEEEKSVFKNKWLAPYLKCNDLFFVLVSNDQVIGYVNGMLSSPGIHPEFAELANQFPAHLHINVSKYYRGQKIGKQLIEFFHNELIRLGISGVHIITRPDSRNVRFYERNGYQFSQVSECGLFRFMGNRLI